MANFKVSETGTGLHVAVEQLGANKEEALKALHECAEGRCTCPTPQYDKMDAVAVMPGEDRIDITLTPKPGESIDRTAIDKCLEYTAAQLKPGE